MENIEEKLIRCINYGKTKDDEGVDSLTRQLYSFYFDVECFNQEKEGWVAFCQYLMKENMTCKSVFLELDQDLFNTSDLVSDYFEKLALHTFSNLNEYCIKHIITYFQE